MTSSDRENYDDGGIESFLLQEVANFNKETNQVQSENKLLTFG